MKIDQDVADLLAAFFFGSAFGGFCVLIPLITRHRPLKESVVNTTPRPNVNKNLHSNWKLKPMGYVIVAVLIAAIAAGIGAFVVSSRVGETPQPQSIVGTWKDKGISGTIHNERIELFIQTTDNEKILYWAGDFPNTVKDGDVVVSTADSEQLSASILGSPDRTKDFTYDGDELLFKITVAGASKTVHLHRA